MPTPLAGERKLTELDFVRLNRLAAAGAPVQLDDLLRDAEVVPSTQVPPDVVTMYATCLVHDAALQQRQSFVVCYPRDAQPARGCISVLSPAGLALLGLKAGELASWTGPGGKEVTVRIEQVLFQPEAAGDYAT